MGTIRFTEIKQYNGSSWSDWLNYYTASPQIGSGGNYKAVCKMTVNYGEARSLSNITIPVICLDRSIADASAGYSYSANIYLFDSDPTAYTGSGSSVPASLYSGVTSLNLRYSPVKSYIEIPVSNVRSTTLYLWIEPSESSSSVVELDDLQTPECEFLVVPVNKVVYGSNTLIDLTDKTVTAQNLLKDITAHDRSGASISGAIPFRTHFDLTANVEKNLVTIPAGYYPNGVSVSINNIDNGISSTLNDNS